MTTGIRRGEVCALRWTRVDLDEGIIEILRAYTKLRGNGKEKDTKKHQMRRIALGTETIVLVREHKARCQQRYRDLGAEWNENTYVFTSSRNDDLVGPVLAGRHFQPLQEDGREAGHQHPHPRAAPLLRNRTPHRRCRPPHRRRTARSRRRRCDDTARSRRLSRRRGSESSRDPRLSNAEAPDKRVAAKVERRHPGFADSGCLARQLRNPKRRPTRRGVPNGRTACHPRERDQRYPCRQRKRIISARAGGSVGSPEPARIAAPSAR